ncbi:MULTISPECIES: DUF7768 domain-containing protein [unclassified Blautia]|uniref:DUF7768 domain-containing protein n=1 Tax=unclassified Blautia TaxID=2648079 RepID=UPI003F8B0A98
MVKIFVCSPYRGDTKANIEQACGYCRQVIDAGNIPIAPHVMFSNCLDDSVLEERTVGIQMGLELMELCSEVWVFGPPTEGMKFEIAKAEELGITIKFHDQKGQVDYDNH